MTSPRLSATLATGLAGILLLALSGCSAAPWDGAGATTAVPTSTPTIRPTVTPVINELATGSTKHKLQAGDVSMEVTYWSTLSMDKWTPDATKPVSFSLMGTLGTDQGQSVYLSRVSLTTAVSGPLGPLESPAVSGDQSTVSPGYLIKAPYSYSQTFILPAVDPTATQVTLNFTYEILLQTTPTSTEYAKQTATDSVTIALTGQREPEPRPTATQ